MNHHRRVLAGILAAYLLLTLAWGIRNPLFEAPDEQHHYFTAQAIADTWRLPTVLPGDDYNRLMGQEAAQPPLYYILGALLIAPIDTTGAESQLWFNPFVRLGDASSPANINAFVHTPAEAWPWHGMTLAAHLLRAFSTLLGLGTLLCIYGSGRLLWPAHPERALLATALVAFLPQFEFHHGAVTNDTLIIFTASAAIYQLLRLWLDKITTPRLVLLGLTVGAAMLSKNAGLLLLAYAAGFLFLLIWRGQKPHVVLRAILITAGVALLAGGWLYWRNWQLYGDITATNQFIRIAGGDQGYAVREVLRETAKIGDSLIAVFGWFNVRAPQWVYGVWQGIALLAVVGGLFAAARRPEAGTNVDRRARFRLYGLLCLWPLLVYLGLFQFMLKTPAAQGRLLFPALLPLALMLGAAWSHLPYSRWWRWLLPAAAAATSLTCVAFVIPRAYAPMPVADAAEIAAAPLDADLGAHITLVAAQVDTPAAHAGEWVWLTLFWRAEAAITASREDTPQYVILLVGRDYEVVGKLQSYQGAGREPASLWPVGQVLRERVPVRLADDTATPARVDVKVSLVDQEPLVTMGALKVTPRQWPPPAPPLAQLGDGIELIAAEMEPQTVPVGGVVTVSVTWQAAADVPRDFTTFVHVGDPSRPPLAQGDAPPRDYPTHFWQAGERIPDRYTIQLPADLPAGRYPVQMGMYDPADGGRLPLTVAGERQPYDAFALGWLEVRP
ncbi:MAG: glycosyltransferase family 39 protein [Anaerolineales bacterium]|nr:glycosyltransferase family 39 protein [Anaerolineales bacterium]MCB8950378.1 glycosyltransferase family 39 protein [Ardenticatenales bacterium]